MSQKQSVINAFSLEQLTSALTDDAAEEESPIVPGDIKGMLRAVREAQGQACPADADATPITPQPGFVVKSVDQEGVKVFINMCAAEEVPAPSNWTEGQLPEDVKGVLEKDFGSVDTTERDLLRFPLSMGEMHVDIDRKGVPCSTVDCVVNHHVMDAARHYRPLKAFLVKLALNWLKHKYKLELDMQYKLPKMRYKGDTVKVQYIRKAKKQLVSEVDDLDEPVIPLLPNKKAKPSAPPCSAKQSTSSKAAADKGKALDRQKGPLTDSTLPSRPPLMGVSTKPVEDATGMIELSSRPITTPGTTGDKALQYSVQYVGKPVMHVNIHVTAKGLQALPSDDIIVEASGRVVHVTVPGYKQAAVQLPLAVGSAGATAAVTGEGLLMSLPWVSIMSTWHQEPCKPAKPVLSLGLQDQDLEPW